VADVGGGSVIVGIMCCGSYYSPWTPYTIASIYPVCDKIVVVNAGFDLDNPDPNENEVPLEQVSEDIDHLDIQGKIIEVTDFSDMKRRFPVMTEKEAKEKGASLWFDLRGRNMTRASEVAYKLGAKKVLRIDTDQACYRDVLKLLKPSFKEGNWIFYQYEFVGDVGGELHFLTYPPPASPFNDSVYYYSISEEDWYVGGLAPVIRADRVPCLDIHCAHLRYANPVWLSEEEKFRHFYYRFLYHLWTNEFAAFTDELKTKARKMAEEALKREGVLTSVRPPEVTFYRDPLEYIEEVVLSG